MGGIKISKTDVAQKIQMLVVVLLFSFDFFTYITTEENSVLVRLLTYAVLLCLYMFYVRYYVFGYVERKKNKDVQTVLLFVFLCFYLVRLVVDTLLKNVYQEIFTNNYTAVFMFLNSVIFPFFIISIVSLNHENMLKIQTYCGVISIVCLVSALIGFYRTPEDYITGGRVGAGNLDTISLGHLGTTVAMLGLYWYDTGKSRLLSVSVVLLGIATAFFAGSRGPIVALAACFLFFFLIKKNWKILFFMFFTSAILALFFEEINSFLIETWDVHSLQRFYDTLFEMDDVDELTSGRGELYAAAWQNILDYPLFGYSFVTDGKYVHNFVLEAFMATGLIGGFLFCGINVCTFIRTFLLLRGDKSFLFFGLLFVQYFFYAMFSRSMITLPVYWLMLFLVNRLYVNNKIK